MKKTKTEQADAEPRNAHIKLVVRTPDGGRFDMTGPFPNTVAFAIYMLACDWGDGKTHKVRSKADKEYEAAARAFLDASKKFYDRVDKPKRKAS